MENEVKTELNKLYEQTKEGERTAEYRLRSKIFVERREEILKEIGEENRGPFEELTNLIHDMDDELSRQAYANGFAMAIRLFIEAI